MKNLRFYLVFISALLLALQIWTQRRGSPIIEWGWMLFLGLVLAGIFLASRRAGPGSWRHWRKVGAALLAVGLAGAVVTLLLARA